MRSYIFTQSERQTIVNFLIGSITRKDPNLMVILSRIRHFYDLSSDIDLYVRLREVLTANTT
ncbi:MAG: hypothetical protein JSW44_04480 [Candidatus Bathyarchaeota archaeon]|nr:MAG: hypothetical protein JSW44_04480 [Candidatus Bathyarchaeota archaeon]